MGKINVLSFAVANLIAAGEVVDRPASVIKELLENAIDAGATRVTVEIQHGGVSFMRVADNGCGMSKEDLPVAIRRHATSKIHDASDLGAIMTLGFRGEALAAIAAVSELRIITRTADAEYGSVLVSKGGEVISVTEQGAPVGTTVIVENLFGNVPARRKFLKKDVSEAIAVTTYTEKIALSHPEIALRLIVDGTVRLDTAGDGNRKSAMYAVFGKEFAAKTIPVSGGNEDVTVEGFIGRSDNVRPKRNYENFFINGRYVNSRTAAAALEQAYTSYIPPEKFPACVLYLTVNPAAVDVNVHPAKLEVKFSNEKPVFDAVYYAVRTALENNSARPDMRLPQQNIPLKNAFVPIEDGRREPLAARQVTIDQVPPRPDTQAPARVPEGKQEPPAFGRMSAADYRSFSGVGTGVAEAAAPVNYAPVRNTGPYHEIPFPRPKPQEPVPPAPLAPTVSIPSIPVTPVPATPVPGAAIAPQTPKVPEVPAQSAVPAATPEVVPEKKKYRMIGEAFRCYIIAECDNQLLLIDQHAAHERILFERLKRNMKTEKRHSQLLMVPLPVPLSAADAQTLVAFESEVRAIGFSFTVRGNLLSVDEIPVGLSADAAAELLQSLAPMLHDGTGNAELARDIVFEKALYQSACKAAIKGGRDYPPEYLQEICDQLSEIPDITVCPHGRPVAMVLTKANLDRQFGRT